MRRPRCTRRRVYVWDVRCTRRRVLFCVLEMRALGAWDARVGGMPASGDPLHALGIPASKARVQATGCAHRCAVFGCWRYTRRRACVDAYWTPRVHSRMALYPFLTENL